MVGEAFSRRRFLALPRPAAAIAPAVRPGPPPAWPFAHTDERDPDAVAHDEDFWADVARAYPVDRSLVNLDHARVAPAPATVQDAMARHLAATERAPAHVLGELLLQREAVRQQLARYAGVDPEEIALTRNTSEGMQAVQFGLEMRAGDEVLTTTQDYPRMITTFRQRSLREGIVLRQIPLPVPCDDPNAVVAAFEEAFTERTRLLLVCHVLPFTGQILPVERIAAAARARGVFVLVDGAHGFGHLDVPIASLGADAYATSLHKGLGAPHGTGMLYVRKDKIGSIWPLFGAPASMEQDVRKFEEVGTQPLANILAAAEALAFHEGIGPARKLAQLVALRDRWATRLGGHERVRMLTDLRPGMAGGIATFTVDGLDSREVWTHLWERHKIIVRPIRHPRGKGQEAAEDAFEGVRVSPGVETTLEEIDRFVDAVEGLLREG